MPPVPDVLADLPPDLWRAGRTTVSTRLSEFMRLGQVHKHDTGRQLLLEFRTNSSCVIRLQIRLSAKQVAAFDVAVYQSTLVQGIETAQRAARHTAQPVLGEAGFQPRFHVQITGDALVHEHQTILRPIENGMVPHHVCRPAAGAPRQHLEHGRRRERLVRVDDLHDEPPAIVERDSQDCCCILVVRLNARCYLRRETSEVGSEVCLFSSAQEEHCLKIRLHRRGDGTELRIAKTFNCRHECVTECSSECKTDRALVLVLEP
mmetsp:Transcript_15994/g.42377  ORF Transcript_15994/g.42377 Transcript_15994/m.42377 type:complete len:262 (+) Transcript_15994:743-1528(+)